MQADINTKEVQLSPILLANEKFYKISNSDELRPFFMSVVSASNHWLFISSNGGLSAGRKNAEHALFPYSTDDKITESAEITGSKTILRIEKEGKKFTWEPFSDRFRGRFQIQRNLFKSVLGNKIIFEEVNEELGLTFQYEWNSSDEFGFVKKSKLLNNSYDSCQIDMLDGVQNLMPFGVASDLQRNASNLVDAYKRNEIHRASGLGIYALSAIIVDKAEPSEALKANTVWSAGIPVDKYLASSLQLDAFRRGENVHSEFDVKAEKGAYFINSTFNLEAQSSLDWILVAEVNQDRPSIEELIRKLGDQNKIIDDVHTSIEFGNKKLTELLSASDGLQQTADHYRDSRHLANVLFNIMRGGIFDNDYAIEKRDFLSYLEKANFSVAEKFSGQLIKLPNEFSVFELRSLAMDSADADFQRLCLEYMPLKFSRRHGDPSRPWNKFSINTADEDGNKILDYEGNWRDIFQNWEGLAESYPLFCESMIHKFLNASTFDGYNPYRVTKDGFDWEIIEADDPWSYIGYWGDHQIIYLQKLLESLEARQPNQLSQYFNKELFVYANVPYRIKPYEQLLVNPKDTIDFHHESDRKIRERRLAIGVDGALLTDASGGIIHVNLIEKLLAMTLSKMSNFVPGAGIWMNTQRPEWNDANNALVGNGVSMVTLYYLRRFLSSFNNMITEGEENYQVSSELFSFYTSIKNALQSHTDLLSSPVNDNERKRILDALGLAGSEFRMGIYSQSFTGNKDALSSSSLNEFISLSLRYIDATIKENLRQDGMYHAYNLLTIENENSVSISHLSEMLEGQVAILSAKYLSSQEVITVLDALKSSSLFREDQYSYLLYPNKQLPGFLDKNNIPPAAVAKSELIQKLIQDNNKQLVVQDVNGTCHFNGNFKNSSDVLAALNELSETSYESLVQQDADYIEQLFETVFNHKAFTGRSGTFFGYEGLGSIYWHMVSKLNLAVMECCQKAIINGESDEIIGRLLEHYYEINEGIGVHKSPELYGAFPTDPYSHTPAGKGAQQPGMTGQVKEDILSRYAELGIRVINGQLSFHPAMLRAEEFLTTSKRFSYVDLDNNHEATELHDGELGFTYCQLPIIYQLSSAGGVSITMRDGSEVKTDESTLSKELSESIFKRSGSVKMIRVHVDKNLVK